jgi:hypothetical protein
LLAQPAIFRTCANRPSLRRGLLKENPSRLKTVNSLLAATGTNIFTVMSALAVRHRPEGGAHVDGVGVIGLHASPAGWRA